MAKVGYLGHSCFTIDIGGKRLLLDPFITPNPLASGVDLAKIQADYILVTHGHQDHLADLMALAEQTKATVLSCFEITSWVESKGYGNTLGMNHGGVHIDNDLNIKMVNAVHSSSFPDGTYAGNPAGFVIWTSDFGIYYAGDTALHMDMMLIGEHHTIDLAILPIGDRFTMGYTDASTAAGFAGTSKVVGMHYDTFPPIKIDHEKAKAHFIENGKELILMAIQEEKTFER